ncbi:MAG: hypothetical protein ACOYPR_12840 [Saprospiraceae bacterium]|jgi:hypothetical protein
MKIAFVCFFTLLHCALFAQNANQTQLWGRWEVLSYAEEGVPVDKKQAARPQAIAVYNAIKQQRAQQWYGYSDYDAYNRRENRAFENWQQLDSTLEVLRLTKAIETPYFVVFFPDSTLSHYNKDLASGQVLFPQAHHYSFAPASMSLDIVPAIGPSYFGKSDLQVLELSATRLVLYLPETAERVVLEKTAYILP